ncbi:mCG145044, partial [Mus musculus]
RRCEKLHKKQNTKDNRQAFHSPTLLCGSVNCQSSQGPEEDPGCEPEASTTIFLNGGALYLTKHSLWVFMHLREARACNHSFLQLLFLPQ